MSDVENLKAVRLENFARVPRNLLYQAKGLNVDPDLLQMLKVLTPDHVLYGFFNENGSMVGIVFFSIDLFAQAVFINLVSFAKEYQVGRRKIWNLVLKLVRGYAERFAINRLYALTTRPKALKKYGWEDTGSRLMEYRLEEN